MRTISKNASIIAMIIFALVLASCGSFESADGSSEAPDAMEFTEDEVAEEDSDAMEFTEEEVAEVEGEGMEFEEDEGLVVDVIESPPEGSYTLNQNPGTIICPNISENFADDYETDVVVTVQVDIAVSDDELTVTMGTPEGSIQMGYVEEVIEGELLGHWEGVISPGGLDQLWTIYWNLFDQGQITGEIYNEFTTSDGTCVTTRPFDATPN